MIEALIKLRAVVKAFSESARAAALESRRANARGKQERAASTPSPAADSGAGPREGPSPFKGESDEQYGDRVAYYAQARHEGKAVAENFDINGVKAGDLGVERELDTRKELGAEAWQGERSFLHQEGYKFSIKPGANKELMGISRKGKRVTLGGGLGLVAQSDWRHVDSNDLAKEFQAKHTELYD